MFYKLTVIDPFEPHISYKCFAFNTYKQAQKKQSWFNRNIIKDCDYVLKAQISLVKDDNTEVIINDI